MVGLMVLSRSSALLAAETAAALGRVVRRRRLLLGLGQRSLSASAGLHENTVQLLERGVGGANVSTLVLLAGALGTTASELMHAAELEKDRFPEPDARQLLLPFDRSPSSAQETTGLSQ